MKNILLLLYFLIHCSIIHAQWEEVFKFPGSQGSIRHLVFLQGHEGFATGFPNILYRTLDYGNSWDTVHLGSKYDLMGLQFVDDSVGYAITAFKDPNFLFKTIDKGKTWNPVVTNLNISIVNSMYFINDTLGFVGSSYDVYKTINGGKTWTIKQVPSGSNVEALIFTTMDRGFGTGCNSCFFMETKDQGKTWQSLPYKGYDSFEFVDSLYGFASGSNFLHTIDGGDTWNTIYTAPPQANKHLSCPVKDTCYSVGNLGIFKTTDGWKTWSEQGTIPFFGFVKIDCTSVDTCYAITHTNRLFRTFNGGVGGILSSLDDNKQQELNTISLFPNPASDLLHLDADNLGDAYIYTIRDMIGQSHLEGKGVSREGIDVSRLVAGYYWLTLDDNTGRRFTAGFVKE
ncbi:MAG: T9SS type A sorting domain-containing protein [Saprospiraceae bacterium]|nr:T9SS type A sorting domain-containing protein [Saprospiraceae bacterium]